MDDNPQAEAPPYADQQVHDYMTAGTTLDRISSELYLDPRGIFAARLSDARLNAIGEAAVMLHNSVSKFGGEYSASIIMANLSSDLITTRALLATADSARTVYRETAKRQETIAVIAGVCAALLAILVIWLLLR